jgi:hypothetical protein
MPNALEANAAMKSIVRRDSGASWKTYLTKLAKEAGIEDPTDAQLRQCRAQGWRGPVAGQFATHTRTESASPR